jgi:hypothetical protein
MTFIDKRKFFVLGIQSMEEVTAGVYLVSINRSRYSVVYGGGHAQTAVHTCVTKFSID